MVSFETLASPSRCWLKVVVQAANPSFDFLLGGYVFSLRALLTLRHFHGNFLTFLEALESFHLDRAVMDEYILSALSLNKSKSFVVVEPFNGSGHSFACHINLLKKLASRSQRLPWPARTQARVILLAKFGEAYFFARPLPVSFTKSL
jgi:hypothetical protein